MQLEFRCDGVRRVVGEHPHGARRRRAAADRGQRSRVVREVKGVLEHVERECLLWQRPVGQPGDEGMRQDRAVDIAVARPQLGTERLVHRATISVPVISRVPDPAISARYGENVRMTILAATCLPQVPPERLREVARAAEDAGLAELWLWEDCFWGGAMTLASALLAWTDRLAVGIGVLPVPLRNVALTAMEAAALERMFPGRVTVGVGHGVQDWMGQVGARAGSPLTLLAEYLQALRGLLGGERVTTDGRYVKLDDVALGLPPRQPAAAARRGDRRPHPRGERPVRRRHHPRLRVHHAGTAARRPGDHRRGPRGGRPRRPAPDRRSTC